MRIHLEEIDLSHYNPAGFENFAWRTRTMSRLILLAVLATLGCSACGSSMSTKPLLQPGAFVRERSQADRDADQLLVNLHTRPRMPLMSTSR